MNGLFTLAALALAAPVGELDLSWTDVHDLAFEGQGWTEVASPFDRLPAKAEGVVRGPVWSLSRDSSGMCARFVTDATSIHCRWNLTDSTLEMAHMPATGVSGVDLYVRDEEGTWRWLACPRPTQQEMSAALISGLPAGTREYMLYLPLYNGVTTCEVGVPDGSKIEPGPDRPEERALPIVFYGTSITHGGCASRPGMPHPAILGRRLDRPIINLGFSGNGTMDMELADLLGELEAAVYVVDCLPNMNGARVSQRVVPFVERLRSHQPDTPILLVEDRSFSNSFLQPSRQRHHAQSRAALKTGFEELQRDGVPNLHYLEGNELLGNEDTVDGSHPTDLGFVRQANVFFPVLKKLVERQPSKKLELDFSELPPSPLGIGGGARPLPNRAKARGVKTKELERGLQWLVDHQDSDGKWDADEFTKHGTWSRQGAGPGAAEHDVGVTGLALLALMGDGHTMTHGEHKESVLRGVTWLRNQQDPGTGLFGEPKGHTFMYSHAIATLAICEAYLFSQSPILKASAEKGVGQVLRARNPYGAWRYGEEPIGDQDTSITGWMVAGLATARDAGIEVKSDAFEGALRWVDEVTDPLTGRVGYDTRGSMSSRTPGVNDHFPTDHTEGMTAVGLLSRFYMGQDPLEEPVMKKHAALLLKSLPDWDADGLSNDMYYWYYGSYAMFQMGGEEWEAWNGAMTKALSQSQRKDGAAKGSWDPIGTWGSVGGRVYSTALAVLCLESPYRYAAFTEDR